jgi:hypothetical protein
MSLRMLAGIGSRLPLAALGVGRGLPEEMMPDGGFRLAVRLASLAHGSLKPVREVLVFFILPDGVTSRLVPTDIVGTRSRFA